MGATRPHPAVTFRTPANRLVALALILCAISLAGCGKKDRITAPIVSPRYPVLSTPQNVMIALATAYSNRDSVEYGLLFDHDYQGTSIDRTRPADQQTSNFTKADEIGHVRALANRPTVTSVDLDFQVALVRYRDGSDPVGWATIQTSIISLVITDGPDSFYLPPYGEYMEFKFEPTTPDASSPTDTTWKIVRWTEFYNP